MSCVKSLSSASRPLPVNKLRKFPIELFVFVSILSQINNLDLLIASLRPSPVDLFTSVAYKLREFPVELTGDVF